MKTSPVPTAATFQPPVTLKAKPKQQIHQTPPTVNTTPTKRADSDADDHAAVASSGRAQSKPAQSGRLDAHA